MAVLGGGVLFAGWWSWRPASNEEDIGTLSLHKIDTRFGREQLTADSDDDDGFFAWWVIILFCLLLLGCRNGRVAANINRRATTAGSRGWLVPRDVVVVVVVWCVAVVLLFVVGILLLLLLRRWGMMKHLRFL
jgi:hypothetical protein